MELKLKRFFVVFICLFSFNLFQVDAQDFITVKSGKYIVGAENLLDNPKREIHLESFEISATEITNKDFEQFVLATGYVTVAEKYHNAQVFEPGLEEFRWLQDSTAYWRYPNGVSRGDISDKMDHPVTCISYHDVMAYCAWAKVRLPTFDEWEVAAKAGSAEKYFEGVSGDNILEFGNIWHGRNHLQADTLDGFMWTAPVKSFKPNPWGLYDVLGNVFEFCEGRLERDGNRKVAHARGGSWWCSKYACSAFNTVFIGSVHPAASFSNLGFRVVKKWNFQEKEKGFNR